MQALTTAPPPSSPQVLDPTPSRLHLSLPAQLRWHRADVGASVLDALTGPGLRPLLPPRIAGLLGAYSGVAPATGATAAFVFLFFEGAGAAALLLPRFFFC